MHYAPVLAAALALLTSLASSQDLFHETVGVPPQSYFGWDLIAIGDIDGDGARDLVATAPYRFNSTVTGSGEVVAISGATGAQLWSVVGPPHGDRDGYGTSVALLDDFDQDGLRDVGVAANTFSGPGLFSAIEIRSAATGDVIQAIRAHAVVTAFFRLISIPDRDGDGVEDIATSSRDGCCFYKVRIYSTQSGQILEEWLAAELNDLYGFDLTLLDDLDADGVPDFAIDAQARTVQGLTTSGVVEIVSGASGAILRTIEGPPAQYARFGSAVTRVHDVDGDGVRDLAIGNDPPASSLQGPEVRIVSPMTGATLDVIECPAGVRDLTVYGDYDQDGVDDLLIGSSRFSANGLRSGEVRIASGATGLALARVPGAVARLGLGHRVVTPGDLDGDGIHDFAASGSGEPGSGTAARVDGRVQVFSAVDAPLYTYCDDGPPPNSTGVRGSIGSTGSRSLAANDLVLTAEDLPLQSFGFFLVSSTPNTIPPPGGGPFVCLRGPIGRIIGPGQVVSSGATGAVAVPIDLFSLPTPTGPIAAQPGDTFYFQYWHRDTGAGSALSNGLGAVIVP